MLGLSRVGLSSVCLSGAGLSSIGPSSVGLSSIGPSSVGRRLPKSSPQQTGIDTCVGHAYRHPLRPCRHATIGQALAEVQVAARRCCTVCCTLCCTVCCTVCPHCMLMLHCMLRRIVYCMLHCMFEPCRMSNGYRCTAPRAHAQRLAHRRRTARRAVLLAAWAAPHTLNATRLCVKLIFVPGSS